MTISRTGDITPRIIYEPYFISGHIGLSDFTSDTQRTAERDISFFHIGRSIHGIAERMRREGEYIYIPDLSDIYQIDALHAYANVLSLLGIYTEIDSDTAQGLRQIAINAGIDPNADRTVVVDAVAQLVRSAGRYTLTPGTTPENEDFALYFLQELREGYCIHFATVATLMLRSLDIPARFTSGYIVTVAPNEVGQVVVVTDMNAHAWVEVFYDDIGWLYLEATPSGGGSNIPLQNPHTPAADSGEQESPAVTPDVDTPQNQPDEYFPDDLYNGYTPSTDIGNNIDNNMGNNIGTSIDSNTQQEAEQFTFTWLHRIIITIACIAIMIIAIIARSRIMRRIRKKHFNQANSNKAIIYMWRYIKRLGRREAVIPNDIEELALKARFSQHKMTEEERAFMATYTNRLAFEISSGKGDYGRLWLKYVRALC
jgi:hypothetical protein